jgi:hypothetical protein
MFIYLSFGGPRLWFQDQFSSGENCMADGIMVRLRTHAGRTDHITQGAGESGVVITTLSRTNSWSYHNYVNPF